MIGIRFVALLRFIVLIVLTIGTSASYGAEKEQERTVIEAAPDSDSASTGDAEGLYLSPRIRRFYHRRFFANPSQLNRQDRINAAIGLRNKGRRKMVAAGGIMVAGGTFIGTSMVYFVTMTTSFGVPLFAGIGVVGIGVVVSGVWMIANAAEFVSEGKLELKRLGLSPKLRKKDALQLSVTPTLGPKGAGMHLALTF